MIPVLVAGMSVQANGEVVEKKRGSVAGIKGIHTAYADW
jgi:hypothetical protein